MHSNCFPLTAWSSFPHCKITITLRNVALGLTVARLLANTVP